MWDKGRYNFSDSKQLGRRSMSATTSQVFWNDNRNTHIYCVYLFRYNFLPAIYKFSIYESLEKNWKTLNWKPENMFMACSWAFQSESNIPRTIVRLQASMCGMLKDFWLKNKRGDYQCVGSRLDGNGPAVPILHHMAYVTVTENYPRRNSLLHR